MSATGNVDIAIIGSKNQASLLRLAGVRRYRIFEEDDAALRDKVRGTLADFMKDPAVGIIMMPRTWMEYVGDILKSPKGRKAVSKVVVAVPSGYEPEGENVKEFYKRYTKRLIGFNIEL